MLAKEKPGMDSFMICGSSYSKQQIIDRAIGRFVMMRIPPIACDIAISCQFQILRLCLKNDCCPKGWYVFQ